MTGSEVGGGDARSAMELYDGKNFHFDNFA